MTRVTSSIVALLLAVSPMLGQTCVLRCHHEVACHRAVASPSAEAPCHQSGHDPRTSIAPTGAACDAVSFSPPALRPIDAGGSFRGLAVAVLIGWSADVAVPAASTTTFAAPPGGQSRTLQSTPIPLRL